MYLNVGGTCLLLWKTFLQIVSRHELAFYVSESVQSLTKYYFDLCYI